MERFFISIYDYFEKRKRHMWFVAVFSFLFFGFFASRIKFEQDITRILPHEKKLDKQQQVFEDSRFSEKLTICISQKDSTAVADPDELVSYADTFIAKASSDLATYIKVIDGKPSDSSMMNMMGAIQGDLPVYLNANDYTSIDSLFVNEKVKQQLNWDYNKLVSPEGVALKGVIQNDPAGMSWLGIKKLQRLQVDERFELYDGYVMTKDHRHIMLFITPANQPNATSKNVPFLKGLDLLLDSLQQRYPKVDAFYYGATATYTGNAVQVITDTVLTLSITVVLLILFIVFYFRKKRAPVVIMVPVLFGGIFSLAIIYFIAGHISLVALGAASIVLGIAVNYSLHVYNHYRHLPDMRTVIKDLAGPMTIGSFTTIGGFLCLVLVPSPLLNDIGLFAAFSLIGATLCSLIFLPHWIEGSKKEVYVHEHTHVKLSWIDKIAEYKPETNKYMVGGVFALTIVFLFTSQNVTIETDMMRMNYMAPKLKESERKFNTINSFIASSVYLVAEGNTLEEALENNERIQPALQQLQQKGTIKKISGIGDLLLSEKEQQSRIDKWNAYWTTEKKQQLLSSLQQEGTAYHFRPTAFDNFRQLLDKKYVVTPPQQLDVMQSGALNNYIIEKHGKVSVVTLLKVDPAQKNIIYKSLDGQPGITVLDKQFAVSSLVSEINNEFNNIAWLTSILVFVALFLSYGRIELTLITFIPMLVSWVWILGLMGIFGIKFNIVNIILSTFIFGLGDDYSIFIMDGLLQRYKTGKEHLSSFKSSIFLSAITTILGLGILIFAKHPAMQSIALISIVGIFCVVITSQVMIPFMYNWLVTNRVKKGFAPWTLSSWAKSVFSLTYFALGSFIMSAIGFVLIKLNPFNKRKGKHLFHKIMSKYTWSVLHIMGNVKKTYINPDQENFSKPVVVISNHQSFLDILISTSMHPKVILLTNEWVWKSPVFGAVVRLADYYPVADGVEGSVDVLREKVAQGYSIVVYPEGTRSPEAEIKRFHKGAFYIAEQLGLDILPVLIHGTAYTMTKGDFLLKDGFVTVKYLPRIKAGDAQWGDAYADRKKSISKYFRAEYELLRSERENPRYFRDMLYYNYLYKGPILEWYLRIKIRLEKNYAQFDRLVPKQGRIMDIGCGYGFMSYMLHFLAKGRQITGIDYDEDKIATADHAYLKDDSLNFICADIANYDFEQQEAFIISDVLHYLQPDEQEALIKKCIANLSDDGVLIIRDGDADLKDRQKGTALTEFFSTKVFKFNKTEKPLSFVSSARIRDIVVANGASVEQIDNTRYTSNMIFVIKNNPPLLMYDYDVVIVGSGLGGLVCGTILSMNGYKVGIFEKNRQIGGCLQTYSRDKTVIDTGVHYIGALGRGQSLNSIFRYLGIMDQLKLKQMDTNAFDRIGFGNDGKTYKLAQGYDNFIKQLLADFPEEEKALNDYCNKIKEICNKFPLYNLRTGDYAEKEDILNIDTHTFLASITNNKKLQQVLAGNNLLYAGVTDKTPLYIHALITNSFIESAWKCVDGGSQIAKLLSKRIHEHGGVIQRNTKVIQIAGGDKIEHIVLEGGQKVTGRIFISNLHPAQTMEITESEALRNAYRSRMQNLDNTIGTFLLNIVLKKDTFPYLNYNYYHHETDDAWNGVNYTNENWPLTYALFANATSKHEEYTDSLTIMTYMRYEDVAKWKDTFNTDTDCNDRGADYEVFKKEKAERLLDIVEKIFPDIRNCIKSYYVATPLSYRDYQGTADGSMYGIAKDHRNSFKTFISPRTRLPNLFLTGQNLNLHGILGVTISALITCGELLDISILLKKINSAL